MELFLYFFMIVLAIWCVCRIIYIKKVLEKPSYEIPPKPIIKISKQVQREMNVQYKQFQKEVKERKHLIKKMKKERKYLQYKMPQTIILDNYENIQYDINHIDPIMYETILPIPQEFYYKGQKYIAPEGWLKNISQDFISLKESVQDFRLGMTEKELKCNITDIWKYNNCVRYIIEECLFDIKFYKDNGYLKKIQ